MAIGDVPGVRPNQTGNRGLVAAQLYETGVLADNRDKHVEKENGDWIEKLSTFNCLGPNGK
jgi:hypothetical protein